MRKSLIIANILLSGCASVSFKQLRPADLAAKADAPEGAVYYLPKPYLMVARLPEAPAPTAAAAKVAIIAPPAAAAPAPGVPAGYAGTAAGADKEDAKEESKPDLGASDQSFGAATGEYIVKIVYLPDRSRPMSMSVTSGLFGVGTLKPALQNGWMLTSFDAGADSSKFADVLTAVASIITAKKGGAAEEKKDGGAAGGGAARVDMSGQVLRPGIYDFQFDDTSGRLTKLCAVNFFSSTGMQKGDC